MWTPTRSSGHSRARVAPAAGGNYRCPSHHLSPAAALGDPSSALQAAAKLLATLELAACLSSVVSLRF